MRRSCTIAMACTVGLLAGCGNSRTPVPSLTQPAAGPVHTLRFAAAGVSFEAPRSWTAFSEPAPLVTTLASGGAVIALWRYPAARRPPAGAGQLGLERRALLAAVRARQPGIDVISATASRLAGVPAIVLDAIERVGGALRQSRSTHLFTPRGELVLDEYAPVGLFAVVDRAVFSPLESSLTISSLG